MTQNTSTYTYNKNNKFDISFNQFERTLEGGFDAVIMAEDAQQFVYGILQEEAKRTLKTAEKEEINTLITRSDNKELGGNEDGKVRKSELKSVFTKIEGLINTDADTELFTDVTENTAYNNNFSTLYNDLIALGKELNVPTPVPEPTPTPTPNIQFIGNDLTDSGALNFTGTDAGKLDKKYQLDTLTSLKGNVFNALTTAEDSSGYSGYADNNDTSNTTLSDDFVQDFLIKAVKTYGIDATQYENIPYSRVINIADKDKNGQLTEIEFKDSIKLLELILKIKGLGINLFAFDDAVTQSM